MNLEPRSGTEVVASAIKTAKQFRDAGALVVLVKVEWRKDFSDALAQPVDAPMARPAGGMPQEWAELIPDLHQPDDLATIRHAWEHGYAVIVLEDLCAGVSKELHDMAFQKVCPRIARVTTSHSIRFPASSDDLRSETDHRGETGSASAGAAQRRIFS